MCLLCMLSCIAISEAHELTSFMLQVMPAWHTLMVSRRPVALYISNCLDIPAIVAASAPRVQTWHACILNGMATEL